jgi:general secretion pathway protein B
MSFILDALKKSESDRQRQSGPALFEVKVARPRSRLPLWAFAIAALLVVNLGVVAWIMLRHPEHVGAGPGAASSNVTATTPPVAPPPVLPVSTANTASTALGASAPAPAPPAPAETPPAAGAAPSAAPQASPTGPAAAAATATAAAAASGAGASGAPANPEDFAPAEEPASAGLSGHVRRGTAAGVPLYQELATTTQLPQLRLDLHVFATAPQDRFVMINMHKLREGDSLPEGVHVDNITPDGAVLSYRGSRFLLPRD